MPSTVLLKRDWEKDHVYLVQFPRIPVIPTPSPFALKLETFLRFSDIKYTNVDNEFTKTSSRGQIPFIELNGRQYADSSLIIENLIAHFNKHEFEDFSPSDKATARAFYTLIEHHVFWTLLKSRAESFEWMATDKGVMPHLSGIKAFGFKNFIVGRFQKKIKSKCMAQGVGLLTKDEVIADFKKDLDAISIQLGDKPYLFGDTPKTIDATAFGHLSQFLYTPLFTPELKAYLETSTPNIVAYINRIKEQYWPDWEELTTSLKMNAFPKSS